MIYLPPYSKVKHELKFTEIEEINDLDTVTA